MTKSEFIDQLRNGLSSLPESEINESLTFYSEMIDDIIEEGYSEEDAVSKIGDVDKITSQLTCDRPIVDVVRKKIKPKRRLKAWEITLICLGSPVWLALLIAAFAVILSLYISLWAVVISLWSVFASLIACAVGALVCSVIFFCKSNAISGIAMIGAALVLAGLSIFLFFGCRAATRGMVKLTKKIFKKKERKND